MQRTVEIAVGDRSSAPILRGLHAAVSRFRRRRAERRVIARWMRRNPPEIGRATGCRV